MADEDVDVPRVQENDDVDSRVDAKIASGGGSSSDEQAASGNNDPEAFDLEGFSSLVERELIAYSVSWDPLLRALRAIGASLAGQHRAREAMAGDVRALKQQLALSEGDKQAMAEALDKLQGDLGGLQAQLDKMQSEREQEAAADVAAANQRGQDAANEAAEAATDPTAGSSRTSFVTPAELTEAQRSLARELKRSLSRAFGQEDGVGEHESDGEHDHPIGAFRLPDAPFATKSDVDAAVAATTAPLEAKLRAHDTRLDALQDSIGNLDELSSQLSARVQEQLSSRPPATPPPSSTRHELGADGSTPASDSILLKSIKELRATQDAHERQLKQQQALADRHAADLASVLAQLDDLALQQQAVLSGLSSSHSTGSEPSSSGQGNSGDDGLAGESTGAEGGHAPGSTGAASSAATHHQQPMQLDLSLVFAKIADLRRTTDASLSSLQSNLSSVSGASAGLQAQVDALRNGAVFSEHLQLHMVEAQLAMQKELLARNQRFQERTKPQLADWRRALDDNEAKLARGQADDEILQELQQLQRHYRRTLLAITPLVNSPLSIAEAAQTLADEVRQLEHGRQVGVLPVRVPMGDERADDAESERARRAAREREDEYARKLRFLDEEIAATLQVNVVTEKKNDPLLKALDGMREKLEELWSLWHRNYNQKRRGSGRDGTGPEQEVSDGAARVAGGGAGGASPEALRDVEMRLMGAMRRLGALEEDVERLREAADLNTSELTTDSANAAARRVSTARGLDELDTLRREMLAEVAKVAAMVDAHHHHSSPASSVGSSRRALGGSSQQGAGGDLLTGLYAHLTGREVDGRFNELAPDAQRQLHDAFMKELAKKVTHAVLASDKLAALSRSGGAASSAAAASGGGASSNAAGGANYRMLLDNLAQKVEERLDDARDATADELSRLRKELLDQLRLRLEAALRDLRAELQAYGLLPAPGADASGDSTAVGTKPVMCVACSRPVPVSTVIREAGAPAEPVVPEPASYGLDYELDRMDDDYVYRAGFKMPANDRKILTLPFLSTTARSNKMALSKPEGKRKRPARHHTSMARVENIVREAMELDRSARSHTYNAPPQQQQ